METVTENRVGARELGRLLGVSDTAVRKAVKAGRISVAAKDGKGWPLFDPDQAREEWARNSHPGNTRRPEQRAGGRPRKDGQPTAKAQPRRPAADPPPAPPAPDGGGDGDGYDFDPEAGVPDPKDRKLSYNEAAALEKHYKAKLAELDFQQKIGVLVPVEHVATEVGREYTRVRSRLLAIPSKLAPDVAIVDDVGECRRLLEAAIVDALNELAADAAAEIDGAAAA